MKGCFLREPGIPQSGVVLAAVSGTYPDIIRSLKEKGIETLHIPEYPQIAHPVRSHADMLLFMTDGNKGIVPSNFVKNLTSKNLPSILQGFIFIESRSIFSEKYPHDIGLNALRVQDYLFCRADSTAPEILSYCKEHGIKIISIRQGYARCSTALVNRNSLITADLGICRAAQKCGLDVLKIQPGGILLPGYEYGFIGGCCGLIGKDKIAFTGKLSTHPDGQKMAEWIEKKGVHIVELTKDPLIDIGGIIPLLESISNENLTSKQNSL